MTPKAKTTKKKPSRKTTTKQASAPKRAAKEGAPTLADVAAGYLDHLERRSCSQSTIDSYRSELKAAARALGEDTPVSAITVADVERYFESDSVTKTRAGEPRSTRTIDRSRRVLRLALWWAEEKKLIEKAPVPEDESQGESGSTEAPDANANSTEGAAA